MHVHRPRRTFFGLMMAGVLLALPFAAIACSDDDEPTEEDAVAQACDDFDELVNSLTDFGSSLSLSSSADDISEAREGVSDAFDEFRSSAGTVAEFRIDELQAAWDDFVETLDGLSDQPLSEALSSITTAVGDLAAAFADTASRVDCD